MQANDDNNNSVFAKFYVCDDNQKSDTLGNLYIENPCEVEKIKVNNIELPSSKESQKLYRFDDFTNLINQTKKILKKSVRIDIYFKNEKNTLRLSPNKLELFKEINFLKKLNFNEETSVISFNTLDKITFMSLKFLLGDKNHFFYLYDKKYLKELQSKQHEAYEKIKEKINSLKNDKKLFSLINVKKNASQYKIDLKKIFKDQINLQNKTLTLSHINFFNTLGKDEQDEIFIKASGLSYTKKQINYHAKVKDIKFTIPSPAKTTENKSENPIPILREFYNKDHLEKESQYLNGDKLVIENSSLPRKKIKTDKQDIEEREVLAKDILLQKQKTNLLNQQNNLLLQQIEQRLDLLSQDFEIIKISGVNHNCLFRAFLSGIHTEDNYWRSHQTIDGIGLRDYVLQEIKQKISSQDNVANKVKKYIIRHLYERLISDKEEGFKNKITPYFTEGLNGLLIDETKENEYCILSNLENYTEVYQNNIENANDKIQAIINIITDASYNNDNIFPFKNSALKKYISYHFKENEGEFESAETMGSILGLTFDKKINLYSALNNFISNFGNLDSQEEINLLHCPLKDGTKNNHFNLLIRKTGENNNFDNAEQEKENQNNHPSIILESNNNTVTAMELEDPTKQINGASNNNSKENEISNNDQTSLNKKNAKEYYQTAFFKNLKKNLSFEEKLKAWEKAKQYENSLDEPDKAKIYHQIAFFKNFKQDLSFEEKLKYSEDAEKHANLLKNQSEKAQLYYQIAFLKNLKEDLSNEEKLEAYEDAEKHANLLKNQSEKAQLYYQIAFLKNLQNLSCKEKIKAWENAKKHADHLSDDDGAKKAQLYYQIAWLISLKKENSLKKKLKYWEDAEKYANLLKNQSEKARLYYEIAWNQSFINDLSNEKKLEYWENVMEYTQYLPDEQKARVHYEIALKKSFDGKITNEEKIKCFKKAKEYKDFLPKECQALMDYEIAFNTNYLKGFDNQKRLEAWNEAKQYKNYLKPNEKAQMEKSIDFLTQKLDEKKYKR